MKKTILTKAEYDEVIEFINGYNGLPIECEILLMKKFDYINEYTLKEIVQSEYNANIRSKYHMYKAKAHLYNEDYTDNCKENDYTFLLRLALAEGMNPVSLCRLVLKERFTQASVANLIKNPYAIADPLLCANVIQCAIADNQDGPYADTRRRLIGEEYELKLEACANEAGIKFMRENEMRRLGYEKTPDLKALLPFLYLGEVYNWIESKATFGDLRSHRHNLNNQLCGYANRFGPGIVIYWHGYHEDIPKMSENCVGIMVLSDFPDKTEIEVLNIPPQMNEN